ncbi:MAG: glycosyltransferase family 1 protein [Patescibacteria group bacterium]|jgi:glycosyltransferase involved in cell wall biosynthesis
MKIGINLLQYTDVQGIEIYAHNLLSSVFANDNRNTYILFVNQKSASIFDFQFPNVIKKELKLKSLSKNYLIFFQQLIFPFILKREKIDLLFCPSLAMPLFYGSKVVTILDCAFARFRDEAAGISRIYIKLACLSAKFFSKGVVTISKFSKKEITKIIGIKEDKILAIYGGVPRLLVPNANETNQTLKKFNLIGQDNSIKKYFFCIGNFRPRKNIARLIKSFSLLAQKKEDCYLVLAGKVEKRFFDVYAEIDNYNLRDRILYLGVVGDMEKSVLYQNCVAVTFCSLYEGMGLPILEGQYFSAPIITSNVSSLPEVSGQGALLVDPYDVLEISQAMERLLIDDNLRTELIERGSANMTRFSWDQSAKELITLFEKNK